MIEFCKGARNNSMHRFRPTFVIFVTKDLKFRHLKPSELEIRKAISGNLCRCTGYQKIVDSVQAAAAAMKK